MKRIFYVFFLVSTLSIVSCKKNITSLNVNPTRQETVASANLFSNASINLSDVMASTNVNSNNFRLFVQYWTETIYRDETRYNLNGRSITDRWFATFYRDIIKDLEQASVLADQEGLAPDELANRKAVNEILIVYSYYTLLSSFGNVPYTDALNIDNLQPRYDDAKEVFGKIVVRLNAALAKINEAAAGYGSADLILHDDMSQWAIFGNCLKLKMGMLIADSDAGTSKTLVEDAAARVITANSMNITMNFLAAPPNTNPVWEDLIQSGRHDFVAAKKFIDTLKALNDPRISFYFNPSIASGSDFVGQNPGVSATFNNFSAPSTKLSAPEFPYTFFSYAEMEFYKAEAVERGYIIGGTAESHYNAAIDASIEEWGGTPAQAVQYRSQPAVSYTTALGTFKQKIALQAWIAFYNRGYDAWTEWRRLDFPILPVPSGSASNFDSDENPSVITRLTYPVVEQNLNKNNYEAAAAAIGKDQKTQKLWFDKF